MHVLSLSLQTGATARRADVTVHDAVVAGWTGRDAAAIEKHIRELEELGVQRPATTPIFYRVSASRLTTGDTIEAVGESSGRKVEFVLLQHDGKLWSAPAPTHRPRSGEIRRHCLQADVRQARCRRRSGRSTKSRPTGTGCCCARRRSRTAGRPLPGWLGVRHDRSARPDQTLHRRRRAGGRNTDVLRHARRHRRVRPTGEFSSNSKTRCWAARSPTPTGCERPDSRLTPSS